MTSVSVNREQGRRELGRESPARHHPGLSPQVTGLGHAVMGAGCLPRVCRLLMPLITQQLTRNLRRERKNEQIEGRSPNPASGKQNSHICVGDERESETLSHSLLGPHMHQ